MNRAYSLLALKAVDDSKRLITGMATTPVPDRYGDIVEPEGAVFDLPLPLLWQHDSKSPIGNVTKATVSKKGIEITAQIAREDTPGKLQELLDFAWATITKGLVRGLSIGFRELEYARIEPGYSYRFLSWEWLELSAVTIPANAEASIETIKSILDGRPRAASGQYRRALVIPPPGVSGPINLLAKRAEPEMKTTSEQIVALENKRMANSDRMVAVMQKSIDEGRSTNSEEQEEFDGLEGEITAIDSDLKRLKSLERLSASTARSLIPVPNTVTPHVEEQPNGGGNVTVLRQTSGFSVGGLSLPKGVGFIRLLAARFISRETGVSPVEIATSKGWGDDIINVLRTPRDILMKAAVAPGTALDPTWAGPLVVYQNLQNQFLELLRPATIIGRIPGITQVPFQTKVPRETGETTGYWVGEAKPKPVSKGALDTVTLDHAKVAGITFLTQELLRLSSPSAEAVMVNSLTKALTKLVDFDFLDPAKVAVANVSPASITNGVTPVAASGTSSAAFRADFAALLGAYTASNYSLADLVMVMSQSQALRLGLMRTDFAAREFPDINKDGGFIEGIPVVTSENIALNTPATPSSGHIMVAIAANSILLADDGGVEVDISTEASIQTSDAPDDPVAATTTFVSLWQNNLVGIRCERFITWVKARPGAVAYIAGANYI